MTDQADNSQLIAFRRRQSIAAVMFQRVLNLNDEMKQGVCNLHISSLWQLSLSLLRQQDCPLVAPEV